ncbi:unnamed protein product, partial [Meganyctiphanes norvegica]
VEECVLYSNMRTLTLLCVVGVALGLPQFEKGHVKILSDQRYQDGARFGNYRDQEDGTKYQEETDANGIRTGFWEYVENGQTFRTTFRAGAGIGFQIVSSDLVDPTIVHHPVVPQAAVRSHPQPVAPVTRRPVTQAPVFVPIPTTTTPFPNFANLFDYPGNLDFNQTPQGHRFKFTATK